MSNNIKESKSILQEIKETLEKYDEAVPMASYISLAKEYKSVCVKFDRLLEKERDRNHKFVQVKRDLTEQHQNSIKDLKAEIDKYKRDALKYKTILRDKGLIKGGGSSNDKPILKEDISQIMEKNFSEKSIKELLIEVIDELVKGTLNFNKITVSFFDDNKILLLQRSIYKKVMTTIESDSSSIVSGITNTILRDYYIFAHEEFATRVLEASAVTRGVFKFFENNFVEVEGSKARWNSFAITRFMGDYISQTENLRQIDKKFHDAVKGLEDMKTFEDELDLSFDEYNRKNEDKKKIEKLIHLYKLQLADEEHKLGESHHSYKSLLEGTTKFLLQKRVVIKMK